MSEEEQKAGANTTANNQTYAQADGNLKELTDEQKAMLY